MFFWFLLYQEEEGISIVFSEKLIICFCKYDKFSVGQMGSPGNLYTWKNTMGTET